MASSIDTSVPATGAPGLSEPIRSNFAAAASDIEALQAGGAGTIIPPICQGRLTTESGEPLSSSDRVAQGTLYFTPFTGLGDNIALWDGSSKWGLHTFTEASLALSGLTAGKLYDAFVYWDSGALVLEIGNAWADDTNRADALGTQNGIYVNGSDATKLFVGTIRASAAATTEDAQAFRFVSNFYNRVARDVHIYDATASWNYTTTTTRISNGNSANKIQYVDCVGRSKIDVTAQSISYNASANVIRVGGLSVDSTSGFDNVGFGWMAASTHVTVTPGLVMQSALGYHYIAWVEYSQATGTTTWYGGTDRGLRGTIEC